MSSQRELAFLGDVVPHLDGLIVASRNEVRLDIMEANTSDRPVMFNELVYQHLVNVIVEQDLA